MPRHAGHDGPLSAEHPQPAVCVVWHSGGGASAGHEGTSHTASQSVIGVSLGAFGASLISQKFMMSQSSRLRTASYALGHANWLLSLMSKYNAVPSIAYGSTYSPPNSNFQQALAVGVDPRSILTARVAGVRVIRDLGAREVGIIGEFLTPYADASLH